MAVGIRSRSGRPEAQRHVDIHHTPTGPYIVEKDRKVFPSGSLLHCIMNGREVRHKPCLIGQQEEHASVVTRVGAGTSVARRPVG